MTAAASSCLGKQGFCQCSIVVQKQLVSLLSNLISGLQSALFHPDPISEMAEKMHKLKCRFQVCMPSVVKALGVRCSHVAESLAIACLEDQRCYYMDMLRLGWLLHILNRFVMKAGIEEFHFTSSSHCS